MHADCPQAGAAVPDSDTGMTTIRPRTTVPLTGTTFRTSAQLDHASAVALAWATHRLTAAGGLRVPASGVLRRALAVYALHLEQISSAGTSPGDPTADEFKAVRRACLAVVPDEESQRAAWERLDVVPAGRPPPEALLDVLRGPGRAAQMQALVDSAGSLAAHCGGPPPIHDHRNHDHHRAR